MTMQFLAKCAASISKNLHSRWVLIKFEAEQGHFTGEIAKALGELQPDKTYRITIEEVS
jgi:hypothetical protein